MAQLTHWKRRLKDELVDSSKMGTFFSSPSIDFLCRRHGHVWRDSFWSPTLTLLTFLLQVLDGAKTLRAAVATLLVHLAARGESDLPSCDPSAYCQARRRVPWPLIADLLGHVARALRRRVSAAAAAQNSPSGDWLGHRVWIVDGSSVSMPDTPELQKAFPQPPGQKIGCGFPVAQLVAVFCWSSGAIVDAVLDTLRPHELTLFRRAWALLQSGDVVLADRAYCAFVDMARLLQRGVFGVFRLHQRRKADFRAGRRLGHDDRLVVWSRPERWIPSYGISREEFEQLPPTLTVRLVRVTHVPRGFRSRTVVLVTTLLDPVEAPADPIRALYRDRWTAELNLRSLKTQLGMDVLRGQSEDVVRKEILMHLLAYNLIRVLMWEAACEHRRPLHRLSFTGTLHRRRALQPWMMLEHSAQTASALLNVLRSWIAQDVVPDRPGRVEPRRRKRRPKEYSLLQQPRSHYHHYGDLHAR